MKTLSHPTRKYRRLGKQMGEIHRRMVPPAIDSKAIVSAKRKLGDWVKNEEPGPKRSKCVSGGTRITFTVTKTDIRGLMFAHRIDLESPPPTPLQPTFVNVFAILLAPVCLDKQTPLKSVT